MQLWHAPRRTPHPQRLHTPASTDQCNTVQHHEANPTLPLAPRYYRKPEQLMRNLGVGQPIPMERWDEKQGRIRELDDKLEIMRALRRREERIRAQFMERQRQT